MIIAFQGTGGYSDEDWFDAFRDATSNLTSSVNGCGMHEGYYKMAMKLGDHEDDVAVGEFNAYVNGIEERYSLSDLLTMAKNGKAHITLLGHSMGGAIAQCYALHLVTDRGIKPKNITGRTFNSALAVTEDITVGWDDWINLCVSTDSVPNGLVPGSIYEYGVHRIGRTIWLYDPLPDLNTDTIKALGVIETNIAENKHNMDQTLYVILSGLANKYSAYFNELMSKLCENRTMTVQQLLKTIAIELSKNDKVEFSSFSELALSVKDGFIQTVDKSINAFIENGKLYVELPTDKEYTIEVTSTDDRPSMVAVSDIPTEYGINSISIYEVPESNSTFTVNIPANNGNAILTDANGEAVEPIKKWILGDVNNDGTLTLADVEILQKWLMADLYTSFSDWTTADINRDGKLNACDLSLLKRIILEG